MKRLLLISLAASVCSLAVALAGRGAAWAQNYDRQGAYIGVGFSYGLQSFGLGKEEQAASSTTSAVLDENVSVKLQGDDSPGVDIRGGYRFHPNFAIEGDLQYFTGFDLNIKKIALNGQNIPIPSSIDTKVGSIDTLAMTFNGKAYLLTGRIQPYGLLGLGFTRASFDPNAKGVHSEDDFVFALRFGAGVDCYTTENIVVYLEASYLSPHSDYKFGKGDPGIGADINSLTLGVQYRF
jgi:opacity protein-like surface antigen